jgi:hypothetical protein
MAHPPYPPYPPYPPGPPYPAYPPYAYYPRPPQRSAIPRVVGILAIVFASIGVLSSAVFTLGPLSDLADWRLLDELSGVVTWLWVWLGLSVALFVLHLVAGILACGYRPSAPRLINAYGVLAIALAVADAVALGVLVPGDAFAELRESVLHTHYFFEAVAVSWPIVAMALINSARSRAACVSAPPR